MKNILLTVFSLLILLSCDNNTSPETNTKVETTENFDWLIGKWKRSNGEVDKETYEVWHKINRKEYKGWGYTLNNNDTISKESISLNKSNSNWKLEVKTQEEDTPTYFNLIKFDRNSFTCENNEIDFPNKIHYWKEGGVLKAKVSNSDLEIDFVFNRVKGKVIVIPSISEK